MVERSNAPLIFLEEVKKKMLEDGMTGDDIKALVIGSEHPYECKCATCKRWWELMGPER